MNNYIAHNQRIASEWVLPDGVFPCSAGPFDLCFLRGSIPRPPLFQEAQASSTFTEGYHDFYWPEVGYFRTCKDGQVIVDEKPDAPLGLVGHVLLGPIIADWLMWKGLLVLHANCLVYPGGAFGIVGKSGAGKSTLGAAMVRAQAVPHGDDVISVDLATGLVPFGTFRTKLNPDSLDALGVCHEELPRVYSTVKKKSVVLGQFPTGDLPAARPLRAIYCLIDSEDHSPRIEQVDVLTAPLKVLEDVFRIEVQQRSVGLQALFDQCGQLTAQVPVFRLHRKKDLQELDRLAQTVREHFELLTSP